MFRTFEAKAMGTSFTTAAQSSPATAHFLLSHLPIIQRRLLVTLALAALLVICVIVAAAHGAAQIPYDQVAQHILRSVGLPIGGDLPASDYAIVVMIRLPRVLIGALVGGALAASGAVMQGIFRNPLADPGLLGVGAGGAFGAVLAIVSGAAGFGLWILPGASFVGAITTAMLVYGLAVKRGRTDTSTLLLAGVAVSSFLGALTSLLILSTRDYNGVQAILGWLIGGLSGRGWDHLRVAILPVLVALGVAATYARDLNLFLAGEEAAQTLGVNVPRTRLILLTLSALMTGAAVSIAGGIAFVGLMIPHLVRLIVGPDYRVLLPASALAGAVFLTVADTIARLIVQPAELQVGMITALAGAPFFLFLLWRQRQTL
jgi:iron complex transport system permease protein